MFDKQKIAIVYAGGRTQRMKDRKSLPRWFNGFIEVDMVAKVTPIFIAHTIEPSDLKPLLRVVRRIQREWSKYDGFVVTLPAEHLLYYGNILYRLFGHVGKPIVCTSALEALQERGPNETVAQRHAYVDILLKANMVNAVQAAQSRIADTMIILSPDLVPATHAGIHEDDKRLRVYSVDGQTNGRIDFGIQRTKRAPKATDIKPEGAFYLSEQINHIDLDAELSAEMQLHLIQKQVAALFRKTKGMIIHMHSAIEDPSVYRTILPKQIPVVVMDEQYAYLYEQGKLHTFEQFTPECVAAQFTCALGKRGQTQSISSVLKGIEKESVIKKRI